MSRVDAFLELLTKQNGSDLHLVSGNPPRIRLFGEIHPVKYRELSADETRDLVYEIMSERVKGIFEKTGGVDFAYHIDGASRFRVNAFRHLGGIGAVFRAIPNKIMTLEEIGLPPVLKTLARQRKGLILVTGSTGSGKSTTLSAIVDFINCERSGHIITIEDPVEHVHSNKKCLISQREVGDHTGSFADALRSALREDPDVVLVGELRDLATISLAITAAEMGILILGTLHTNGAAAAIDRIINVFPPGEEPYIRGMLSTSLCGVISQELVRSADNRERLAAVETLVNNSATSNIIREGKTEQLESVIQGGALQGMQSLDGALRRLFNDKRITGEEAYRKARIKANFEKYREQDEPVDTTFSE